MRAGGRLYLLGLPLENMMDVHTAGCCFCEARYSGGKWDLLSFADDRCQSPDYDPEQYAYFGSPVPVEAVPEGAVLTPYSELAAAYAHAPSHVETALNGQLAVDMIRANGVDAYDFVLMDIMMPVMDGYEATSLIRKLPGGDKLKILAFSANAFEEDREKSLQAGLDGHIAKPLKIDELLSELKRFVG